MAGFKNNKVGVYAYLSAAADTTVTTANTFTPILGTFVNDPIEGFHVGTTSIVYDGVDGETLEIDWHSSFQLAAANKAIHFGVAINGETLTTTGQGVVGSFAKNNGQVYPNSGTRVVTLNSGDTIQLQLTSSSDSDAVTVIHFTTTISKFFRGI